MIYFCNETGSTCQSELEFAFLFKGTIKDSVLIIPSSKECVLAALHLLQVYIHIRSKIFAQDWNNDINVSFVLCDQDARVYFIF